MQFGNRNRAALRPFEMSHLLPTSLPPGQQLVATGKWPLVGERMPLSPEGPWQVEISGGVRRPVRLSLEELRDFSQHEQAVDIHCVTRWSKLGVPFRGVPLASLVAAADPTSTARYVSFVGHSARQHSTSLPLDQALSLETLIALEVDGRPLTLEHGGPIRVVVPGRYFYKSLKWLTRIELLAEDRLGYWEAAAGYHNTADPWREQRFIASGISKAEAHALLADRDLRGRDLLGLAAAGRDLAGLSADRALLRNADFRECQLAGACFDGANLSNAHFELACLQGASFRGADLEGANFTGADLRGACLLADSIVAASFVGPESAENGALCDARTEISQDLFEQLTPDQQAYLRGRCT
jgi:DMSO/TMAO reductase YedYZ molybdopterin-dependent catalytic subunit